MYGLISIQCTYEAVTGSIRTYAFAVSRRMGWKFRFPHAVKNSFKTAIFIYDFATVWPRATDGSFSSIWSMHVYREPHTMYVHFTIQRMRLSPYSVWACPNTIYVWRRIQCTYKTVTQRTFLAKKSWKQVHYVQYVELKESSKKMTLSTLLRIYV